MTTIDAYISSNAQNIFAGDFISSSQIDYVNTTWFDLPKQEDEARDSDELYYSLITVSESPNFKVITRKWFRTYLTDFLSDFGGLGVTILSFFAFVMKGLHAFTKS